MPVPNFEKLKADAIKELQGLILKAKNPKEKDRLEKLLKETRDMEDTPHSDPTNGWYGALN